MEETKIEILNEIHPELPLSVFLVKTSKLAPNIRRLKAALISISI